MATCESERDAILLGDKQTKCPCCMCGLFACAQTRKVHFSSIAIVSYRVCKGFAFSVSGRAVNFACANLLFLFLLHHLLSYLGRCRKGQPWSPRAPDFPPHRLSLRHSWCPMGSNKFRRFFVFFLICLWYYLGFFGF